MSDTGAITAARMVLSCSTKRGSVVLAIALWSALDKAEERAAFLAALYDEERKPAEQGHPIFFSGQRVQHKVTGLRGTVTEGGLRKDGDSYDGWWAPACWVALEEEKPAEPEPGQQPPAPVPAPKRTCNRHFDCDAAEKAWFEAHPEAGQYIPPSFHCHDDECEECFGK